MPDLEAVLVVALVAALWIVPLFAFVFGIRWYLNKQVGLEFTRRLDVTNSDTSHEPVTRSS